MAAATEFAAHALAGARRWLSGYPRKTTSAGSDSRYISRRDTPRRWRIIVNSIEQTRALSRCAWAEPFDAIPAALGLIMLEGQQELTFSADLDSVA